MKSIAVVSLVLLNAFLAGTNIAHAAIISVSANHILTGDRAANLFVNGSFEARFVGDPPVAQIICISGTFGVRPNICPNVPNYQIPNWTFTGDPGSYSYWGSLPQAPATDGVASVYFGNGSPTPNEIPFYGANGIVTFPDPMNLAFVHPVSENITNPTTLSQTINGLIVGDRYSLDFYATGESGFYVNASVFGLGITGEDLIYLTTPTVNSVFNSASERYHITFTANAATETFTWMNWGHICSNCTELVLDDVILNRVPEPATLALLGLGLAALGFSRRKQ
jgi:hypothetical protein